MKKKIHFHGEVCILEVDSIPEEAKKIETKKDFKIADSEVTGNDHMLAINSGVALYGFDEDFYMANKAGTKVYCLLKDRHDDLELPAGNYKITPAKEWDHLEQMKRNVLD